MKVQLPTLSCRECGSPVVLVECEPLRDEEREQAEGCLAMLFKPGPVHQTCEQGHRVFIAEDSP